jgi:hypothetical protein
MGILGSETRDNAAFFNLGVLASWRALFSRKDGKGAKSAKIGWQWHD